MNTTKTRTIDVVVAPTLGGPLAVVLDGVLYIAAAHSAQATAARIRAARRRVERLFP